MIVALPLALVVKEAPPGSEDAAPRASRPPIAPIRDVLRQPAFYLLMIGSMCSIAAVGGANQHLKLYLSLDHGYTQKAAAGVASLTLFASLAGRLGMGWLADRWPKKRVMLLIYLLVAASIPILLYASTPTAVTVFAIVFGIGLGGEYMVIPLMAAELFGTRVLGRAMGIILAADGVAEATAPVLVGRSARHLRKLRHRILDADRLRARRRVRDRAAPAATRRRRATGRRPRARLSSHTTHNGVKGIDMGGNTIGIVMNGVTGRMGLNQHLVRSIVAIRAQGGVRDARRHSADARSDPRRTGRAEAARARRAVRHRALHRRTSRRRSANDADPIYFDATLTQRARGATCGARSSAGSTSTARSRCR